MIAKEMVQVPMHVNLLTDHIKTSNFVIDEACDEKGSTLLILAVKLSREVITDTLLHLGASPDIQDNLGNTALHYAFLFNLTHMRQKLMSHNASEKILNKKGETPWEIN
jgi:ankyrin repeat protein